MFIFILPLHTALPGVIEGVQACLEEREGHQRDQGDPLYKRYYCLPAVRFFLPLKVILKIKNSHELFFSTSIQSEVA